MLKKTQEDFKHAICRGYDGNLNFISSDHKAARLNIYRQTLQENLRQALALTFAGIWQLLGEECANSAAYAFVRGGANLPNSGCLDDWGATFPRFLSEQSSLQGLPYLQDYAQYEWILHKASAIATVPAIAPQKLMTLSEEQLNNAKLVLQPSLHLFTSPFAINAIAAAISNPETKMLKLRREKKHTFLIYTTDAVNTLSIKADLWQFIRFIKQGFALQQAADKTYALYPCFALDKAMVFLFKHQLITSYSAIGGK